ncbi:hypothetical protein WJ968_09575 [Achromobacter xylosoxidans]
MATALAAMEPPAPPRFSTTTGWPSSRVSPSANTRAVVSVTPPAPKGTISRTGCVGYACAHAAAIGSAAPNKTARRRRNPSFIARSPFA